jgi:hypothetical protein
VIGRVEAFRAERDAMLLVNHESFVQRRIEASHCGL